MTDYNELYKQLAQEVVNVEGNIGTDTAAFVQRFIDTLPTNKQGITPEAKAELTAYLTSMKEVVSQGIVVSTALGLGEKVRVRNSLRSRRVLALAEQAFVERWNDDLTLSQRLWNWQHATESGVGDVLTKGIKTGESINKLIYDLQYNIEHNAALIFDGADAQVSINGAKPFAMISNNRNQWTAELADSAKQLINNPQAKASWNRTLKQAERYVDKLAETGTKHASLHLLNQLKTAVDKGRLELVDNSLKWWLYDKQLYNLKRIARTEMATATHRAVIDGTIDNEHIIGYRWELSSSHKVFDVCDFYASVEQGLGKGVWRKESVPRHKAHPHCVLGNTIIGVHGDIAAATKSCYQGRVIEIVTRDSRRLTCTPNHSILTGSGWIEAKFLNKGQKVLVASSHAIGTFCQNDNNVPTTIEQIFNTLLKSFGVSSVTVPVSTEDFHGDGRFMNGYVEIVNVDSFLLSEHNAFFFKQIRKLCFQVRNLVSYFFFTQRISNFLFKAFRSSTNSRMSIFSDFLAKFTCRLAHPDFLTFRNRSYADTRLFKKSRNSWSANLFGTCNFFNRFARKVTINNIFRSIKRYLSGFCYTRIFKGFINRFDIHAFTGGNTVGTFASMVAIDEIVEIREYDFCGHVFDLQIEPEHWYFANGIVAHNCMCRLTPRVTAVKEQGSANYTDFLGKLNDQQLKQVLPKWAQSALDDGIPLQKLLHDDGFGLVRKQDALSTLVDAKADKLIAKL